MIALKIDYGLQIEPQFGYKYDYLSGVARRVEAAGFESMWASDHFLIKPEAVDVDCFEAWTLLTALAVETKKLRLGNALALAAVANLASFSLGAIVH